MPAPTPTDLQPLSSKVRQVVRTAAQLSGLRGIDGELPQQAIAPHTGGSRNACSSNAIAAAGSDGPTTNPRVASSNCTGTRDCPAEISGDISPSSALPAGSTIEIPPPTLWIKAVSAGRQSDLGLISDFRVRAGICLTRQASTNPAQNGLSRSVHPDRTALSYKGQRPLPGRAGDRIPVPWLSAE